MLFNIRNYTEMIQKAIACFWDTRNRQLNSQLDRNNHDTGNRGAVTGGKTNGRIR